MTALEAAQLAGRTVIACLAFIGVCTVITGAVIAYTRWTHQR